MEKDHEEECERMQTAIADKESALSVVNTECTNLTKALEERNRQIDEKEKMIREGREEIGEVVRRLTVMEEKARLLVRFVCSY
ncbi:unnamed protein product [Anisakis simplex]|uniref:Myosin_tail_1 domain-containing protein n=1 Tax=Anisakis simplex TaxID=6269 RepID=A0A0M3KJJ0_ANISI|nr:unnamed protein product [Anisakis simplex]